MKVNEVVDNIDGLTDENLVRYLNKRTEEVFDLSELSGLLNCRKERLKTQLQRLVSKGSVSRYVMHKARYLYGCKQAIAKLETEINDHQKSF